MRERVQSPQNGCVTEAMTPISPLPSRVAPAAGDLAAVVLLRRLERELGVDQGDDLGGRDDVVEAPAVRRTHVHVLDEAEDVTAALEVAGERDDLVVVDAALHDGVHLHPEARGGCGVDPVENAG